MTPIFLRHIVCFYEKLAEHCATSSVGASWSALNQGQGDPLVLPPPSTSSYGVGEVDQVKRLMGPGLSPGAQPSIMVMIMEGLWPTR